MAKAPTTIGLAKIGAPGQPKKISITVEPTLAGELDRYAEAYAAHYGERPDIETLIPHMLHSFIAADRGFKKWKSDAEKAKPTE